MSGAQYWKVFMVLQCFSVQFCKNPSAQHAMSLFLSGCGVRWAVQTSSQRELPLLCHAGSSGEQGLGAWLRDASGGLQRAPKMMGEDSSPNPTPYTPPASWALAQLPSFCKYMTHCSAHRLGGDLRWQTPWQWGDTSRDPGTVRNRRLFRSSYWNGQEIIITVTMFQVLVGKRVYT